jgi:hypothetical protein
MKKESNHPPSPGMVKPAPPPKPPAAPVTTTAVIAPLEISETDLNEAKRILKHIIELREEIARIMGVPKRLLGE